MDLKLACIFQLMENKCYWPGSGSDAHVTAGEHANLIVILVGVTR